MNKKLMFGLLIGLIAGIALTRGIGSLYSRYLGDLSTSAYSYAKSGEDLVVANIFQYLLIKKPTYIDVGACDPVSGNNTYYFYKKGSRGVLVEPNPAMVKKLRAKRGGDTVLGVGIGATDEKEADYYLVGLKSDKFGGEFNTFSKELAERVVKVGKGYISMRKIKMPLVNINRVMDEQFKGKAPDYFSLDVEGFEMPILKSLDFKKYRPKVFCIETITYNYVNSTAEISEFMESKNYADVGGNYTNKVFVDNATLKKAGYYAEQLNIGIEENKKEGR